MLDPVQNKNVGVPFKKKLKCQDGYNAMLNQVWDLSKYGVLCDCRGTMLMKPTLPLWSLRPLPILRNWAQTIGHTYLENLTLSGFLGCSICLTFHPSNLLLSLCSRYRYLKDDGQVRKDICTGDVGWGKRWRGRVIMDCVSVGSFSEVPMVKLSRR